MCDPISLAVTSFMVTAGSSVMKYEASSQQADAQNELYAQNKVNAERAAVVEHQQNAIRMSQEHEAAGEKNFQNTLDTQAKGAHAQAAADYAGVTGLSVDSLVRDIWGAGGRTSDAISHNSEMTLQQLNMQDQSIEARKTDRINSVKKGVQPSGMALGLEIGGDALSAGTSYYKMTK